MGVLFIDVLLMLILCNIGVLFFFIVFVLFIVGCINVRGSRKFSFLSSSFLFVVRGVGMKNCIFLCGMGVFVLLIGVMFGMNVFMFVIGVVICVEVIFFFAKTLTYRARVFA